MINYGVHSSRVYSTFTSIAAGHRSIYHSTMFYSQLSMTNHKLRQLFATKRQHDRLADPHVGLVDVFDASRCNKDDSCQNRSRSRRPPTRYVLDEAKKRKEGARYMVARLKEFKQNWGIFTEGSLLLSLLESSVDDGVLLITIPRQITFQPLANVPPVSREVAT